MADPTGGLIDRFSGASGLRNILMLLLCGGFVALGQAPFGLSALAFLGLCLSIFLGVATRSPRQAAGRGWAIGFGFSLVTFLWIVEPFLVDIQSHGWMAPFALFLMAGINGLFWAAAFWGASRLMPIPGPDRAMAIAVFLAIAELTRSYVLTGFPWALSAYIWVETPVYQLASMIGPHGLSLATLMLAALAVFAMLRRSIPGVLFSFGVLAAGWYGGAMIGSRPDVVATQQPVIRLIQPNAAQHEKWDPQMIPVFYDRQLALTAEPADVKPDLVIWPEVAVAFLLNDPVAPLWEISDAARGARVILGGQRLQGARAFNSLVVLGQGGEITDQYDKHHLVPFGEYIPGEWLFSRVGLKAMTAKYGFGYSAGPGPQVLDLGDLGRVMPLLCYEGIFPHEMRRVDNRPDWMLILTNDAWFGKLIGPYQHLAQARARAIEFALPMVRVANTGVSAVFDGRGRLMGSLPLGQAGRLDIALPPPLKPSLYWRTGDIPAVLVMIVLFTGILATARRNRLTGL